MTKVFSIQVRFLKCPLGGLVIRMLGGFSALDWISSFFEGRLILGGAIPLTGVPQGARMRESHGPWFSN